MSRLLCLFALCAGSAALAQDKSGTDWPTFLGPDHTGVARETEIAASWPADGPPLVWEKKVGTGYSAPSVIGNRLVLHHRVGNEEIVQAYDAKTGAESWEYKNGSAFKDPYGYNNGPRCTPLLTKTHCYTLGAAGHLACVEIETGKKVWSRDLQADYRIPRAFFGIGCTPILEGDKLIVLVGGQRPLKGEESACGVVAFNAKTGKPIWNAVGKPTWDGATRPKRGPYTWTGEETVVSYSSPIAATINGKRHLLCLVRQGLVSLDPETGTERFKYWFRATVHESVNAARPVVIGDKILLSAAYRMGSVLLKVNSEGDAVEEVWRNPKNLLAHWSTPIVANGFAYGFSGRHESEGELRCIDLKDGSVQWSTKGFGRGSKIKVGDKFVILGERGTLAFSNVNSKTYDEIARIKYKQIHHPSWTAPVLSQGLLYLRCEDAMICLDLRAKE